MVRFSRANELGPLEEHEECPYFSDVPQKARESFGIATRAFQRRTRSAREVQPGRAQQEREIAAPKHDPRTLGFNCQGSCAEAIGERQKKEG